MLYNIIRITCTKLFRNNVYNIIRLSIPDRYAWKTVQTRIGPSKKCWTLKILKSTGRPYRRPWYAFLRISTNWSIRRKCWKTLHRPTYVPNILLRAKPVSIKRYMHTNIFIVSSLCDHKIYNLYRDPGFYILWQILFKNVFIFYFKA